MYNYMKTKFDAVYLTAASINTLTNKTFDTLVNTFTVGADISMASHKITNLTPGTAANDAATVSQISTGSLPVNPVAVPNGINDTLSAPPGTPVINESYLVAATATGAWTGLEGHIVNWNGSVWIDVLGRAVIAGDRLGLAIEHGTVAGGFATKTGNIAQVVVATPGSYTYTFTAPAGNMVFTVNGVNSTDYGHQYTYNGTSLIWVETGVGGQNMAVEVHNAAGKTTPVDADEFGITDSATSYGLKHLTFANLKATLLVYFNTAYVALTGNQSIAGIKTFSTQLIVPAPTNLTSTSNDAVALNTIFSLTWKTPVAVVSTTNQNIGAFVAGTVIDGVTCTQGTNILLV